MALTIAEKTEVRGKFAKHPQDSGSSEVQVALLTARINSLQGHFEANKKDHSSRRGLLRLVGQRRRLLKYLQMTNIGGYRDLIATLGIRK